MKRLLLDATPFLALAALDAAAKATPFDFTYTGSLVAFTVPATDTYQILAFGAQGADSAHFSPAPGTDFFGAGGRGAEIGGDFGLTAGETLQIAVGGAGMSGRGGGGGGSFVVGPGNTPLVIAGGGGGGGAFQGLGPPGDGDGGLTGPDGSGPIINGQPTGGTGGNGGAGSPVGPFAGGSGGAASSAPVAMAASVPLAAARSPT